LASPRKIDGRVRGDEGERFQWKPYCSEWRGVGMKRGTDGSREREALDDDFISRSSANSHLPSQAPSGSPRPEVTEPGSDSDKDLTVVALTRRWIARSS